MRVELTALAPAPTRMVANLPYSVATPVLLRTIDELPSISGWLVMVQREIAERLRAAPGTREYGSPSVIAQLACEVTLVRTVDPAVFTPRPGWGRRCSACAGGARRPPELRDLVRAAFAHAASRWRARWSWASRAGSRRRGRRWSGSDSRRTPAPRPCRPRSSRPLWELLR